MAVMCGFMERVTALWVVVGRRGRGRREAILSALMYGDASRFLAAW